MTEPPTFYSEFRAAHPTVASAYEALGQATRDAGPLPPAQAEIVKLALAAGARLEGAVHSHARRALEAGAHPEELRHVPMLAITTLGFPAAMAVRALVEDVLQQEPR
jgi:alkylhydroperoxidase/carboxymuconolactone decarboxylase family protein YurZ